MPRISWVIPSDQGSLTGINTPNLPIKKANQKCLLKSIETIHYPNLQKKLIQKNIKTMILKSKRNMVLMV